MRASFAPRSRSSSPRSSSVSIACASPSTCSRSRSLLRRERREPCVVEDLVGPCSADPGEHALVAEQGVEPARLLCQDRLERVGAEAERLGPEVSELGFRRARGEQPHARALLRARLGEDELSAAFEREPEGRRLRPLLSRAEVAQATGCHQVHQQDELPVLGRKEQPLRASPRAGKPPAVQRRKRRIERLQRRDVRRTGLRDGKRAHRLVELASPRLHLGELGHLTSVVHGRPHQRSGAARRRRRGHASRARGCGRARRDDGCVRRPKAGHAAALVGQAVPGATAGARFRRPRPARARDRLGVASRRPCAARCGPHAAHTCGSRRGRPRVRTGRPPALAAQPQLLRKARGDARGVPRERLADARATGSPTIRCSARTFATSPTRPASTRKRSRSPSTVAAS